MGKYIDLTGQKFERLIVLSTANIPSKNKSWKCLCDCGNIVIVQSRHLRNGETKSCGCYKRDYNLKKPGESAKHSLYKNYKDSAKRRGVIFSLTLEEFSVITKKNCFYCGREPEQVMRGQGKASGNYTYNGIDRLDNDIGYILSNCVPCCKVCNRAKSNMSYQDFIEWIERISSVYINRNE